MIDNPVSEAAPWTRRRWIKQFMLGSAVAMGVADGWRGTLLADISTGVPPSDIIPLSLSDFPGMEDGSAPSIQLQLSVLDEVIMINRAPYDGLVYVLDSRCTHQGCIVNKWVDDGGYTNIVCPCHGSVYDVDGSLIKGAAGPNQPPLNTYNFTYDGVDLLKIHVPGLNLKINSIAVETASPTNKRLRLTFPGRAGCDYGVRYTPDLVTPSQPVSFAITSAGTANQSIIQAVTTAPLNVWVDNASTRGFYKIELILSQYS